MNQEEIIEAIDPDFPLPHLDDPRENDLPPVIPSPADEEKPF